MKDITLIRKILKLVSYDCKVDFEYGEGEKNYYFGHDTSMDAERVEAKALKILKEYSSKSSNKSSAQQDNKISKTKLTEGKTTARKNK